MIQMLSSTQDNIMTISCWHKHIGHNSRAHFNCTIFTKEVNTTDKKINE